MPVLSKRLRLMVLTLCLPIMGQLVAHANTVYPVNLTITSGDLTGNPLQTDTLLGSITTDGTIGVISISNIVSYDLNLIDDLNPANSVDLTPTNSTIVADVGGALSATATGLIYDYSVAGGGFLIQANSPGVFSGYSYFCLASGYSPCAVGETISPQYYSFDGVDLVGANAPVGTQPLAPPTGGGGGAAAVTPEPASLALLGTGALAGVATLRRRFSR